MTWDRKAPFDDKGNLMHYPESWRRSEIEWRPETEFEATLRYKGFARGRSAAYFHFSDEKGRDFPMFLADFSDIVRYLCDGQVAGTWVPTKRGQNFGIKMVPDA